MKRNKKICIKCNKEISVSNFKRHIESCKGVKEKRETQINKEWLQADGKYKCPHCNKSFTKYGIGIHIYRKHTENGSNLKTNKTGTSWNKGLTKETDSRVKLYSENISKSTSGKMNHFYGKTHSKENKKIFSEHAIKNELGGKTHKKIFKYKNINMDSSYELIIAKELDRNGIVWERPKPLTWTDKNNKIHRYYPDFYLSDFKVYLDPKNDYLILKDEDKIKRVCQQNNVIVFILNKNELTWDTILNKIKTTILK